MQIQLLEEPFAQTLSGKKKVLTKNRKSFAVKTENVQRELTNSSSKLRLECLSFVSQKIKVALLLYIEPFW